MFYDPSAEKETHSRNLPHWQQVQRLYFVTFRLADSIPQERLEQIKAQRKEWNCRNSQPYSESQLVEYYMLFSKRVEDWLDDHYGKCVLGLPECRSIVADAMEYFNGKRYELDHWVIMPNHVHVLVMPLAEHVLSDICHNWKSYTAHQINKCLGNVGQLWQHESFDHIVRSEMQLEKFREYIGANASKCPQRSLLSQARIK